MSVSRIKSLVLSILPESLLLPLKKRRYLQVVRNISVSEEPELAVLPKLAGTGDTVVDIGANIGVYTYSLAKLVGPTGKVIAAEPIPSTFAVLANNVSKLKLHNVQLLNVAVSDSDNMVRMEVPSYASGGQNFYQARISDAPSATAYSVRAMTLDSLLSGVEKIAFIKIDVEGVELSVLEGAKETLARKKPMLLVEVSGNPNELGSSAEAVFGLLVGYGYGVWVLRNGQLHQRRQGEQAVNYFFLPN